MTTAKRSGVTKGQYSFATVPSVNIPRSKIDRSCGLTTAFDESYLIPIFVDEALPGDTLNLQAASYCRMATPIFPLLDNIFMDFFYFAVPIRLIWDNWAKFNGEQVDPGDSTAYTVPVMTENVADDSLSDYLTIPTGIAGLEFNSLWHRAYNLIWNEWFRDENLQDSVVVDTDDGPDTSTDYQLLKRGKRHDYFTSCLPWTQKGDAVVLPLGTTAPVVGEGDLEPVFLTGATHATSTKIEEKTGDDDIRVITSGGASNYTLQWDDPKLEADLTSATASTINQIREAFQVQRMLERDARGGTRYTEIIRSHFGVVSPDQRLQRPEYLGGGTSRVNINPVAATTQLPPLAIYLGDLAAYGTQQSSGIGFIKSFTEHCVILGLVNVRADLRYQQGLDRMFSRQTRPEFFWPSLQHLGEQPVLNKEIYAQGTSADDEVFGYQERYAEYKYKPSKITGPMRSSHATPLDPWHLGIDFASLPLLNDVFIEDNPPFDRVVKVPSEATFKADFYFKYTCTRPMALRAVPGLIDHF